MRVCIAWCTALLYDVMAMMMSVTAKRLSFFNFHQPGNCVRLAFNTHLFYRQMYAHEMRPRACATDSNLLSRRIQNCTNYDYGLGMNGRHTCVCDEYSDCGCWLGGILTTFFLRLTSIFELLYICVCCVIFVKRFILLGHIAK